MKSLVLNTEPESPYYPEVFFNAETGVCEISGESYMEEAYKFYLPLINWIKEFIISEKKPLELHVKLIYFNTSSSRLILDMLDILKKFRDEGNKVKVKWFFDSDDPDVKDEVEDFEIESGMDIELVEM
ncbi:MAG: DUF1987 domain-containing protein [Bacteroidota bacterium]|nr:MAG: DUF1987 domain-containing protein [Bacteroidota bacterium]